MAVTGHDRSVAAVWAAALGTALAMGTLAIAVDQMSSPGGRVLLVVASTGLSWAGAAAVLGAWSPRPLSAAISGFLVLLGAVVTYYVGIGMFSFRDTGGGALRETGSVWGAVAAIAGPVIGALGWYARKGTGRQRAVAWGAAGGLLMSQGVYLLTKLVGVGVRESGPVLNLLVLVLIAVPLIIVVLGARSTSLRLALATMAVVAVFGGLAWSVVMGVV